ncbi:MAG: phytoene/squalene synthase family protein [Pseudomonadota bacterium]|nr:phytoene/squalene synthase family protein [Pseudomonadota bacterium]
MTVHGEALDGFIAKWRARWPEWSIAEVFVPASQRGIVLAWFSLLQELTDAAWRGDDPAPGLAKLAWWQEELQGWSQGRRRHPLGVVLQSHPVPWMTLANALPELRDSRTLPHGIDQAFFGLRSFAEAAAMIEAVLFQDGHTQDGSGQGEHASPASNSVAATLMVMHPSVAGNADDAPRAALLSQWSEPRGPRARRIMATLARARLARRTSQPLPQWRALWLAWRAARR